MGTTPPLQRCRAAHHGSSPRTEARLRDRAAPHVREGPCCSCPRPPRERDAVAAEHPASSVERVRLGRGRVARKVRAGIAVNAAVPLPTESWILQAVLIKGKENPVNILPPKILAVGATCRSLPCPFPFAGLSNPF